MSTGGQQGEGLTHATEFRVLTPSHHNLGFLGEVGVRVLNMVKSTISDLGPKWVRSLQIETNSGLFFSKSRVQYIICSETQEVLLKVPNMSLWYSSHPLLTQI